MHEAINDIEDSSFPGWAIAVIVIGSVALIVLIGLAMYCVCKKKGNKYEEKSHKTTSYQGPQSSRPNDEEKAYKKT